MLRLLKSKHIALTIAIISALIWFSGCGSEQTVSAQSGSAVKINEIVTSNAISFTHEMLGSPDWIELYNSGPYAIELTGCGLTDNIRDPHKFVFPECVIMPGEYLIICAVSVSEELSGDMLCTGFGLSKNGDTLFLTDRYYNIIQQAEIPPLPRDIAWSRRDDDSFGYCATPTPGEANSRDIVTRLGDLMYAEGQSTLRITEVMPSNRLTLRDSNGDYYPWAEIYNDSDTPVLLQDYYISDDKFNFGKWRFPNISIPAHGYVTVMFSDRGSNQNGELHAGFMLGSEDTELYITDSRGAICAYAEWPQAMPSDISAVYDNGDVAFTAFPTPGDANSSKIFTSLGSTMDSSDPVRISEVLANNRYSRMDSFGDRPAWIELHNYSQTPVPLKGYYISDNPNDTQKWPLPNIELGAGEYILIFLSGRDIASGSELHASFRLGSRDKAVLLTCLDGFRIDRIDIPEDLGSNISIGRDSANALKYYAQPTPGTANTSQGFDSAEDLKRLDPKGVFISEVSAASKVKSGQKDWIELYNGGDRTVDLGGWFLSDDPDDPAKFKIQSLKIPSKGYACIYASDKPSEQTADTAPFGISSSGETLMLSRPDLNFADVFETGVLKPGITSGRNISDASGSRYFFAEPTMNKPNSSKAYVSYAAQPEFSRQGGFVDQPFELRITCSTPNASIHYTLDGSEPTQASPLYMSPIQISSSTPVRAVAICDGLLNSEITTATYLFDKPHTVPVVCLSASPSDFQAVYSVIDRWQKIERPCYIEYYETDGALGIAFPSGFRANGASTLLAAQKSLALNLSAGYGCASVTYPFFKDYKLNTFSSLVLRNSGQDRNQARLRDDFFALAVKGLDIDYSETRLTAVYINGKYWGLYNLRENQNEDYLNAHYGADPGAVDIIRRNTTALEGQRHEFKRVRAYALGRNLADEKLFADFCNWVDVSAFTDYLIAQTYFANGDMFNQKYWRSQDYQVKWRPVFFDIDMGLFGNNPRRNILSSYFNTQGVPSRDGSLTNMDIYCGLVKNAKWREYFVIRYIYVVENHFTPERLVGILDAMAAEMEPEMPRHMARWKSGSSTPSSMEAWKSNVSGLRKTLEARPEYALRYLQSYFNLTDAQMEEYRLASKNMAAHTPPQF